MNETTTGTTGATQYTEFVWRRLEEPLRLLGWELPWQVWVVCLGVVLALALVYVVLMYRKDAQGVGPWWATLLGLLRLSVYALLAWVFLLPARQSFVETRTESKVVVVWDVSASMHTSDEMSTGRPNERLTTRMDQVVEFLNDKKVNFLTSLEKKNPVSAYRLGSKLDEDYLHFVGGRVWTREDKENPPRDEEGRPIEPEQKPLAEEYWRSWLNPVVKVDLGPGLSKMEEDRLTKLSDRNANLLKEGLMRGTNLGDALSALISKEMNNRVQGIVVFTDGRNTEGSPNAFTELANRARSARIPLFVVGIGEDREKVKIDIVDTRTSPQIQPEDRFRVVTEITGEGLPGQNLDVTLEITHVSTTKKRIKDKEGNTREDEVEALLPLYLIEREDPENPKSARAKIPLGTKLVLKPTAQVTFDKGVPPRATVEWQLDAATFAAATGKDLNAGEYRGKRWEIAETTDDSELKYRITVPRDKREGPAILDKKDPKLAKSPEELKLREKFHVGERVGMKVIKKPLRVLLLAAAANRDYQFVRSLLVREMEKKRLELAIHLQPAPNQPARAGVVQDVPKERLLHEFPDSFKKKKDLTDLSSFDVIVAFDPDWNRLSPEQIRMTKNWVEQGGGLVMVGGYINTVELIRPQEGDNADRYKPILDLLPVVLDDRRAEESFAERKTDDPHDLDLSGATRELEFLKLDEELEDDQFTEDWKAFFFGTGRERRDKPVRGFYSLYPVQQAKVGALVVARYNDPGVKLKDGTLHPYIVLNPDALPRVVWIGSAETWRLREYKETFHERFWTKLIQYAASKSKGGVTRGIRVEYQRSIPQNRYFPIEARIDAPDGGPADRNIKPQITLEMPVGVDPKEVRQPIIMMPHSGSQGWFSGRFLVKSPGEYGFRIVVPRQPGQDSDTIETGKFTVTEANPELDNTRPDFDRMYRLASEADDVIRRMNEADRAELKRRLQRPARVTPAGEGGEAADRVDIRDDRLRLYFDLKNAGLIPSCMIQDIQKQTSRGPHHDLWDDGVTVYEYPLPEDPNKPPRKPVKISYILLSVVGLLSLEWLIRKLLRLA